MLFCRSSGKALILPKCVGPEAVGPEAVTESSSVHIRVSCKGKLRLLQQRLLLLVVHRVGYNVYVAMAQA